MGSGVSRGKSRLRRLAIRSRVLVILPALALGLLAGCVAAPYRADPQFPVRSRAIKTVAMVPPDVKVYSLGAGGTRELMDDWSATARKNMIASIAKHSATAAGFELKEFDPAGFPQAKAELEDVRPLFEAVTLSAVAHTYGQANQFQTKRGRFEYSLGPLPALGEASQADALLFVYAMDHISTGGRVALSVLTVLLGAAARVAIVPAGGATLVFTALVDQKSGDLLWFDVRGSQGAHDLREPSSVEGLVADAFADYKKAAGSEKPPGKDTQ